MYKYIYDILYIYIYIYTYIYIYRYKCIYICICTFVTFRKDNITHVIMLFFTLQPHEHCFICTQIFF